MFQLWERGRRLDNNPSPKRLRRRFSTLSRQVRENEAAARFISNISFPKSPIFLTRSAPSGKD